MVCIEKTKQKNNPPDNFFSGETIEEVKRVYTFEIPLADGKTGKERIDNTSLRLDNLFGPMEVFMILAGNNKQIEAIQKAGVDSGWIIDSVRVKRDRIPKQIILIPIFLFMFWLARHQIKRRRK